MTGLGRRRDRAGRYTTGGNTQPGLLDLPPTGARINDPVDLETAIADAHLRCRTDGGTWYVILNDDGHPTVTRDRAGVRSTAVVHVASG